MALFGVWNTVEIALSPEFRGEVIRLQFAFACNTRQLAMGFNAPSDQNVRSCRRRLPKVPTFEIAKENKIWFSSRKPKLNRRN